MHLFFTFYFFVQTVKIIAICTLIFICNDQFLTRFLISERLGGGDFSLWPDIDDIKSKITSRTRAIVIINPNNPTGAVYEKDTLEQLAQVARDHKLVVCADEIYDRILYDNTIHTPFATIAHDLLCLSFNGLSKSYSLAGFRSGRMI